MSNYIPNIPNNLKDAKFARSVSDAIRQLAQKFNNLESSHIATKSKIDKVIAIAPIVSSLNAPIQNLQSPTNIGALNNPTPAGVQSAQSLAVNSIGLLEGQAAQPQYPYVASYDSIQTIPSGDPQLQDKALYRVVDSLYVVDEPNKRSIPVGFSARSANVTQVSVNANTTNDQDLMTLALPANTLNNIGKTIRITCFGNMDYIALATAITFQIKFVSPVPTTVSVLSFLPVTSTGPLTNIPFLVEAFITTASAGTGGTVEAHGWACSDNKTGTGHQNFPQLDLNTAVSAAIDLTVVETVKLTISFNSASASNVARQRMMIVEY